MKNGRYDEALAKLSSIESKQSEVYEKNNPHLLTTQANIAFCLMENGRYDEALNKLCSIESKQSELYENDNPQLLTTRNNIAICLELRTKSIRRTKNVPSP